MAASGLKCGMCPGLEIYELMNTQCDSATQIFYPSLEENISSERVQSRNSVCFCQRLSINHFPEYKWLRLMASDNIGFGFVSQNPPSFVFYGYFLQILHCTVLLCYFGNFCWVNRCS